MRQSLMPYPMDATGDKANWKSFRSSFLNDGQKKRSMLKPGHEPFSFKTEGVIWSTPVIDVEGNVYVGSADKHFYAVSPQGTLIWKHKIHDVLDAVIDSAAVITRNGTIVVPGGDGYLHALKIKSGRKIWEFRAYHATDEQAASGEVVNSFEGNVAEGPDGNLYAGSDNGHMYCISPQGKEIWNFGTKMMIWSAPVFDPEMQWVCFGSLDGHLYLLDPASGKLLDKIFLGEIKASPAFDPTSRTIVIGNTSGKLHALSVKGGKLVRKWTFGTKHEIYSSASYDGKTVYFGSTDGHLYALNHEGKLLWKYNANSPVYSSPVMIGTMVVFGAVNGKIYALNRQGVRIWSYKTTLNPHKANLDSSPAVSDDGKIYIGSYNGNLYSLPLDYCLMHPSDERCEFGGTEDVPYAAGKMLRIEDRNRNLVPAVTVGLSEPVKVRLVCFKDGRYIPNAAINSADLSVKITPHKNVKCFVSSNGHYLNIFPDGFWDADVSYRIEIKTSYYRKEHVIKDRFKWILLPKIHESLEFDTRKFNESSTVITEKKFGIENLSLYQPLTINGLIAAALDGQKFILSFSRNEEKKLTMNLTPAYKKGREFKALSGTDRKMKFSAEWKGNHFVANGKNQTVSAMGATIPMRRSIITGEIEGGKIRNGTFFGIISGPRLKGNMSKYRLPMNLINETCDHKLDITVLKGFEGCDITDKQHD